MHHQLVSRKERPGPDPSVTGPSYPVHGPTPHALTTSTIAAVSEPDHRNAVSSRRLAVGYGQANVSGR